MTHHAWRAQMGSISVMHTMAPRALRAVQQPFPTYRSQGSAIKRSAATVEIQSFQVKAFVLFLSLKKGMTHLPITTHNHLFASKHDVCGPLQAVREKENKRSWSFCIIFIFFYFTSLLKQQIIKKNTVKKVTSYFLSHYVTLNLTKGFLLKVSYGADICFINAKIMRENIFKNGSLLLIDTLD